MSYKNEMFDRMGGNPMSFQIRWDCFDEPEYGACKHNEFLAWSEVSLNLKIENIENNSEFTSVYGKIS